MNDSEQVEKLASSIASEAKGQYGELLLILCDPCEHCAYRVLTMVDRFCPQCGNENPGFVEALLDQSSWTYTCDEHEDLKASMNAMWPNMRWCPSCGRALANL